jgi:Ca2+-transporting ATPase
MVDESLLTGESVPVAKSITDPTNKIFSSTLVTQGRSIAKVIATGTSTEFGKIGKSLQQIESTSTRLQKEMKILI